MHQHSEIFEKNYMEYCAQIAKLNFISLKEKLGSPQDIDDVSFVSEQELQRITKNALDVMSFLDRIHFDELGSP